MQFMQLKTMFLRPWVKLVPVGYTPYVTQNSHIIGNCPMPNNQTHVCQQLANVVQNTQTHRPKQISHNQTHPVN